MHYIPKVAIPLELMMPKPRYLGPSDVADLLRVNPMTVRRMSDKGLLPFSVTPGGHRRYDYADVVAYCAQNNIPIDKPAEVNKRVLLVDDDCQILRMLAAFINSSDESIAVDTARDGFEAGLKVMSWRPQIVVTDIVMPKLDGIEVCKQLKCTPETQKVTVVGMTGSDDENLIDRFITAGGHRCLRKPIKKREFVDLIRELL